MSIEKIWFIYKIIIVFILKSYLCDLCLLKHDRGIKPLFSDHPEDVPGDVNRPPYLEPDWAHAYHGGLVEVDHPLGQPPVIVHVDTPGRGHLIPGVSTE